MSMAGMPAATVFFCHQLSYPQHEGSYWRRFAPCIQNPNQRYVSALSHQDEPSLSPSLNHLSRRRWLAVSFFSAALVWSDQDFGTRRAAASVEDKGDGDVQPSGVIDGIVSLFDPNEKSKSGKLLPKGYLKSAREVVKNLKASLQDSSTNESSIRRSADSAKEAIRNYLQDWRGQKIVASEESYKSLESAFRILSEFYSKKGPRAVLPPDIKSRIMDNLNAADSAL